MSNKDETELAGIFLDGKTVSEAMEIIGKRRALNHVSRKAFTEAFNVMQELKDFDQEPNWTDAMLLSNKYSIHLIECSF